MNEPISWRIEDFHLALRRHGYTEEHILRASINAKPDARERYKRATQAYYNAYAALMPTLHLTIQAYDTHVLSLLNQDRLDAAIAMIQDWRGL